MISGVSVGAPCRWQVELLPLKLAVEQRKEKRIARSPSFCSLLKQRFEAFGRLNPVLYRPLAQHPREAVVIYSGEEFQEVTPVGEV